MLLGLDLGTTAVKLLLVEPGGRTAGRASRPCPARAGAPGHYEQDPEDWWEAIRLAAGDLAAAGGRLDAVTAVGLSAQTHGLVLVDDAFRPVRPCLTWADRRAVAEARELAGEIGALVLERCANPLMESFTLPKLAWVARHEPDVLRRAAHLGLPKDFVRQRLTGTWETDPTDAASTLLADIARDAWDDELVAAAGASAALLPPIRPSAAVAGTVTPQAAHDTGLPAGVPVAVGASDVACAALGAGADAPGVTYVNLGTAAQLLTPTDAPREGSFTFRGAGRERLLAMASVYAAGRSMDWALDDLLRGPLGRGDDDHADIHARVDAAVAAVEPGARGLLFLPHLLGASTPWHDARARGALIGMTPAHEQADVLRAVIEGVALAVRIALERLTDGAGDATVRLGGGPARSPVWSQIVADACGVRVDLVGGDSSALGAAMLGGLATGAFADPADAVARCVRVGRRLEPGARSAALYAERAELFREACDALTAVFHRLGEPPVGAAA